MIHRTNYETLLAFAILKKRDLTMQQDKKPILTQG
jgi:hypothetical protein